jgi:hypothetical protein
LRNNVLEDGSGFSCYFKDLCAEFDSLWQDFPCAAWSKNKNALQTALKSYRACCPLLEAAIIAWIFATIYRTIYEKV